MLLRLGEFMVRTLNSFSPTSHVTRQHLSYDQDQSGFRVTVLHLPRTKTAGSDGEDIYWASQDGDTDPTAALAQHLCYDLSFALRYADTSDCFLSSLPPSSHKGSCTFTTLSC